MKKDEKIIISKKLADDLLWWLQNAPVPCVTVGESFNQRKTAPMILARDSMVEELRQAKDHLNHEVKKVRLTIEDSKMLLHLVKIKAVSGPSNNARLLYLRVKDAIEKVEGKE